MGSLLLGLPVWRSTAVTLAATVFIATHARAQEPLPLLSTEVVLSDFGVTATAELEAGRVSVVHALDGPRLVVHYLRDSPTRGLTPSSPLPSTVVGGRVPPSDTLSALWVWNTDQLLGDPAERAAFLDLIRARGIDRVFLNLPAGEGRSPRAGFVPFDGSAIGPLVAELRDLGALTYALDGDPAYALPENHDGVLRTVERVATHNRSAPPEQRFYGVRYDVEPYLLPGFQGPLREQIFSNYLRLVADVSAAAHGAGLVFGVDVPFWLDGPDEVSGELFEGVLDGSRMPVLDHLLERVDDVAVMAYRTFSTGPDGALAHARGEVVRAQAAGVDVFVGIETTRILDEDLYTLRGRGRMGLPTVADAPWIVAQDLGDGRATLWLSDTGTDLGALAEATGAHSSSVTYWFAGAPVSLPGDRLSFESLGADAMRRAERELLEGLVGLGAFRGLAYHDYRGLKALLAKR